MRQIRRYWERWRNKAWLWLVLGYTATMILGFLIQWLAG
jgi:hypothetical protein